MKKLVVLFLIVIAIIGLFFKFKKGSSSSDLESTHIVKKGELSISVSAAGLIQPENRLEIRPPVAGRIDEILVKEGSEVKKGDILAWMSSTERAALLDAAAAKGAKELEKWSSFYKATPIMAPITGTIILRSVEPGQSFTQTDPILTMSDRLIINANVDETDIAQIKVGLRSTVILDAYSNNPINGTVSKIAYEALTVSNVTTYEVTIIPDETPPFMKSGMTTTAEFLVAEKKDILIVPTLAIHLENDREIAYVKENDKVVTKVITTGITDGFNTEIIDGLNENDKILLKVSSEDSDKNRETGRGMGMPRRMR